MIRNFWERFGGAADVAWRVGPRIVRATVRNVKGDLMNEREKWPKGCDIGAEVLTLNAIGAEVIKARTKFPGREKLLAALMEEVGELAQALLKRKDRDEIHKECIQVAAVAVRLLEEGDSDFDGENWSNI